MSHSFWNNQRRHFSAITTLVERVDDSISIVTAFSVSSNLYHICLQLLRSFQWEVFFANHFYLKLSILCVIAFCSFVLTFWNAKFKAARNSSRNDIFLVFIVFHHISNGVGQLDSSTNLWRIAETSQNHSSHSIRWIWFRGKIRFKQFDLWFRHIFTHQIRAFPLFFFYFGRISIRRIVFLNKLSTRKLVWLECGSFILRDRWYFRFVNLMKFSNGSTKCSNGINSFIYSF